MSKRVGIALLLVVALLAVPPAPAQTTQLSFYMTDAESSQRDGAELLAPTVGNSAATHQFSPALGNQVPQLGPTSYEWVLDFAWTADLMISGDTTVSIFFDNGVDATATTTATISAIAADGTVTELAQGTHGGTAEVAAHEETITIESDGAILPEGSRLMLTVSVTGLGAVVNMQYGGAARASGITSMEVVLVDTDGDGFGDSAERAAGTDPEDELSYPGAPPPYDLDDDGLNDTWEAEHFNGTANATDDVDADGCDNLCEFGAGTDPNNPDTDGDGISDGLEIAGGTNPLVADAPEPEPADDSSDGDVEVWLATLLVTLNLGIAGIALFRRFA